jgi:hypothetical protein
MDFKGEVRLGYYIFDITFYSTSSLIAILSCPPAHIVPISCLESKCVSQYNSQFPLS